MHYVVGFVFRAALTQVVLIRKNRPAYLAGKLNGIGGGVERGELADSAVARETYEEANLTTLPGDWLLYATLNTTRGDRIDFFATTWCEMMGELQTRTAEKVAWYPVKDLSTCPIFDNLHYLVPAAIQALSNSKFPRLMILEHRQ